jgi:hypothetical protein
MIFGGPVVFYDQVGSKEFESYHGALQYLRQYLGRDIVLKEARLI